MSADSSVTSENSGIRIDELDESVRPQDDLFRHVNGKWIERTEIPEDKARYGSFLLLAEEAEKAVRGIIEEAQDAEPGTEERKFGDLFASFMAEERIEQLGAQPIAVLLEQVAAVSTIDEFLATLGRLERSNVSGFLGVFVDNDPGDPERYIVQLDQAGIGLPDESYYREEKFADIRDAYRSFVERMLGLAALPDPTEQSAAVFQLETDIAAVHWDNVKTRDSQATYNPLSWREVTELVPAAQPGDSGDGSTSPLDIWLTALDAPAGSFDSVVLREPSFLEGVGRLLTEDRLDAWRSWLAWQVIRSNASLLSSSFVEANFDFYGRTLSGTPSQRARWKRGVSLVEGAMGEAIGRIYVERHFPAAAKQSMDVLVGNLVEAYRSSITSLDWMTEETQERALEKLDRFTPKVGYPVKWRDYSALAVDPADLVGNVRASAEFEFQRELGKIGNPLDRDEWFMTPQTVNAYYNPGFNEIVFPAAILQYPFFEADRDDAANYGAIGAVIGHEIGHGFDDQGSQYDGDGRLTDWWTEADRASFEERTASLIAQYNALTPSQVPGSTVNGALTIGENIGDLGGLSIAWKAYRISLDGAEPPVLDGLTGAQRFFLSWAQAWQVKMRDEEAARLLAIDPHSPNEFRCNQIVRNIDEFYEAYGVTPSDALWLDESERVRIW
ncbi:M13 family metallopeptidase [Planctomonas psychrotolerans]|uniref:M13 family metallopeptidase n=1 Tax=Planctomonas psychrotolerans TaxID=2528712 RepID=UPI00123942EA|nr:M13-type metalloendopeptidase [Planctomonas psychrotolerans]